MLDFAFIFRYTPESYKAMERIKMLPKYKAWINNYNGDIYRKCVEVTAEMNNVFPALRVAKGLVRIFENDKWYPHQWLVEPSGSIVDPTKRQWAGIEEYKEIKDDDEQPVGKCMHCGEYVFGYFYDSCFCGLKCSLASANLPTRY